MTQETDNSHYIARHLTKPWEFTHPKRGKRQLWCYDFASDAFSIESSRSFYTTAEPWPDHVERFLNHYLETPLARFVKKFTDDRDARPTEVELRAMKLAVMMQAERSGFQGDLSEIARRDELHINTLVSAADELFRFVNIPLRQERLFFPSAGVVIVPLLGTIAPAVALHPSYLCVIVPLPCEPLLQQLVKLGANPNWFTAFSTGLSSSERIVLPGCLWGRESEESMRGAIREARNACVRATETRTRQNLDLFGSRSPTPRQWIEAQNQKSGLVVAAWAAADVDRSLYELTDDHIPRIPG